MRTACAYIRVSDERQDEYSPESQRKRIVDYAALHELYLPETAIFYDDGISAKRAWNRTAFQEMIARAKMHPKPFDVILVWKFSRFARNQEESIVYKNLLRRIGVEVVSVSEPITADPFGSLIERIIEWMDEYYLINLSAEVRRGMQEKATRGEAMGRAVFGYDRCGKSYVPNANAPRVRAVFEAFANGESPRDLAQQLAAAGVRTSRGNIPTARWVTYMLQNRVYVGEVQWCTNGRRATHKSDAMILTVRGQHEAIVSEALFANVQQRIANEKGNVHLAGEQSARGGWLLQGLLRCSACGGYLVRAGACPPSVQCARYAKKRCTQSHALSVKAAERALFDALTPLLASVPFAEKKQDTSKMYKKRIAYEEMRLRRATAAYHAGVDSLAEYKAVKDEILLALKECENALKTAECDRKTQNKTMLEFLKDEQADIAVRNNMLHTFIEKIVYRKNAHRLEIYLRAEEKQATLNSTADRMES